MRKAEMSHLFIFLIILAFMLYALANGWFSAAGWLLIFNMLINGYPVILQRYNRVKLQS
jgi:hypothetical protein